MYIVITQNEDGSVPSAHVRSSQEAANDQAIAIARDRGSIRSAVDEATAREELQIHGVVDFVDFSVTVIEAETVS